jgi:hypothetical protein
LFSEVKKKIELIPHPRRPSFSGFRPAPRFPSSLRLAGLLFIGGALSGCVYLRLLTVKKQLQDFDANFALSGRPDLVIEFKNPVLLSKDARFLIGGPPLEKATVGGERVWRYEFEMVRSTGPLNAPLERLTLRLHMKDDKLVKIVVPETFMFLFPRNVLIETLKQAKDAEVLKLQKTVRRRMNLTPHSDAELPSLQKTLSLLGPPLETENTEEGFQRLLYRYRIMQDPKDVPIIARLAFSDDGLLRQVVITWDTATVDALYERDEPPIPAIEETVPAEFDSETP